MHDSEFEKQVQQKMQELKFAPGADVWVRVEADIQKKKRRRPVVFWFLLAGLMIGGSLIFYTGVLNSSKQSIHAETTSTEKKNETVSVETKQPSSKISQPKENNIEKNNSTAASATHSIIEKTDKPIADKKIIAKKNSRKTSKPTPEIIEKPVDDKPVQTSETITGLPAAKNPTTTEEPQQTTATVKTDSIADKKEEVTAIKKEDNVAPKKEAESVAMKNKKPASQKNNWQFGITAGAGVSDLGRQLFKPTTVADFAFTSSNASPVQPNYNNRARPSEVKTSNAFHAGAYVSRDLGKRFAVKIGANYDYYSNNIKVGTAVNSPLFVNQGTDMKMVEQYYTSGTTANYDNKYHFISAPVTFQWNVFERKKYGIVWENGVNLARLMKTTALHFDGISGKYYRDDKLFKKNQLMLSSSLMLTLKQKNNVQLYAGPHVQYGISNLLNKDAGHDKHLRYAGLKLMVGFNKK